MTDSRSNYEILVVEDTYEMAQLMLLSLERGGFMAVHVEDGESALEYLNSRTPDLVLLDLNLPGVSGWDVMKYLVENHGTGTIPVIVTTAYGDSANKVIGKLQNVYKYMVKPFKPHELISTVEEALGLTTP